MTPGTLNTGRGSSGVGAQRSTSAISMPSGSGASTGAVKSGPCSSRGIATVATGVWVPTGAMFRSGSRPPWTRFWRSTAHERSSTNLRVLTELVFDSKISTIKASRTAGSCSVWSSGRSSSMNSTRPSSPMEWRAEIRTVGFASRRCARTRPAPRA